MPLWLCPKPPHHGVPFSSGNHAGCEQGTPPFQWQRLLCYCRCEPPCLPSVRGESLGLLSPPSAGRENFRTRSGPGNVGQPSLFREAGAATRSRGVLREAGATTRGRDVLRETRATTRGRNKHVTPPYIHGVEVSNRQRTAIIGGCAHTSRNTALTPRTRARESNRSRPRRDLQGEDRSLLCAVEVVHPRIWRYSSSVSGRGSSPKSSRRRSTHWR